MRWRTWLVFGALLVTGVVAIVILVVSFPALSAVAVGALVVLAVACFAIGLAVLLIESGSEGEREDLEDAMYANLNPAYPAPARMDWDARPVEMRREGPSHTGTDPSVPWDSMEPGREYVTREEYTDPSGRRHVRVTRARWDRTESHVTIDPKDLPPLPPNRDPEELAELIREAEEELMASLDEQQRLHRRQR